MKEYLKSGVYTRGENEFAFNFNTSLTAFQKAEFVNNVVSVVVGDNYYDFLIDIVFDYEVINKFSDVDLSEFNELDNQVDSAELFIKETNIVDIIKENADYGVIDDLRNSVEKCIEYKTGIHHNPLDEALSSLVKTFEKMISNINIDETIKIGKMLSGISGELTPKKILEAYAETDMYKNNHKKSVADDDNKIKVVNDSKKSSKKTKKSPTSTLQSPNYEA